MADSDDRDRAQRIAAGWCCMFNVHCAACGREWDSSSLPTARRMYQAFGLAIAELERGAHPARGVK